MIKGVETGDILSIPSRSPISWLNVDSKWAGWDLGVVFVGVRVHLRGDAVNEESLVAILMANRGWRNALVRGNVIMSSGFIRLGLAA